MGAAAAAVVALVKAVAIKRSKQNKRGGEKKKTPVKEKKTDGNNAVIFENIRQCVTRVPCRPLRSRRGVDRSSRRRVRSTREKRFLSSRRVKDAARPYSYVKRTPCYTHVVVCTQRSLPRGACEYTTRLQGRRLRGRAFASRGFRAEGEPLTNAPFFFDFPDFPRRF